MCPNYMEKRSKANPANEYFEVLCLFIPYADCIRNVERMSVSLSNYFHSPNICLSLLTCFTALAWKQTLARASFILLTIHVLCLKVGSHPESLSPLQKDKKWLFLNIYMNVL